MAIWLGVAQILLLAFVLWRIERGLRLSKRIRGELAQVRNEGLVHVTQGLQSVARLEFELELDRPFPPTRGFAASADVLVHLVRYIRDNRPDTVVECGSGVSTVAIARAMQLARHGHLHSLENDADFAEATRVLLDEYGLSDRATVHTAPLVAHTIGGATWQWYSLDGLPADLSIDLLFVDGPHEAVQQLARYPAGPLLFRRLTPSASVFLDDAARHDEQAVVRRWLAENPRLEARTIPTEKGCVELRTTYATRTP
jgi:predicted O-methyltransferase YrrM